MKIVAVLEGDATHGGGFNQALNAVLQMRRVCEGRFAFEVLADRDGSVGLLRKLGITATRIRFSFLDRLISYFGSHAWWYLLQTRLRLVGPFERALLARGCDLVYFATPSAKATSLQRLNYIMTVWDLCHRDAPEFPEIREFAEYQVRERLFRTVLAPAVAILADSQRLADNAARRYGVDRERFLAMPFAPSALLDTSLSADRSAVLRKHGLMEGYYFYPAQFWAHKNHVRIVQALALLRKQGTQATAVFAGGDKGNRSHVERLADKLDVRKQVHFLGFVPAEDMRALYEGACALVMPTYFGPTNIPPLEAWMTGTPVIYSALFGDEIGDAALLVSVDSAADLARAMAACADPATRARLVDAGTARLRELDQARKRAEEDLLARLIGFEARRSCWA